MAALNPDAPARLSARISFFFALACGLVVANIYYAQPLIKPIAADLGLAPGAAGLIVTLTQVGYGVGLLFIVPLADRLENRGLSAALVGASAFGLLAAALAPAPLPFLAACLVIGIASVAVQVLVPFAAHLAPEAVRGRAVGTVMSGLMIGIMAARPASSMLTSLTSWHMVYLCSAAAMAVLALVILRVLPRRSPDSRVGYLELLATMARLMAGTPLLQRRALYQAFMFAAFSLFWTTVPLLLAGPAYTLTQRGIGWFALAGAAGAIATPLSGRLADRGWGRAGTLASMGIAAAALLIAHLAPEGLGPSLAWLVVAAIALDFGVQANLVFGQRELFRLDAAIRGRLNGLYMASFFVAGALASGIGAWAFAKGGWTLASWIGLGCPVAALLAAATERRTRPAAALGQHQKG